MPYPRSALVSLDATPWYSDYRTPARAGRNVATWMDSTAEKSYGVTRYYRVIRGSSWQRLSRSTTR